MSNRNQRKKSRTVDYYKSLGLVNETTCGNWFTLNKPVNACFHEDSVVFLGNITPQSNINLIYPVGYEKHWKLSRMYFEEFEQNCNTCKKLQRIPHDKDIYKIYGVMTGKCLKINEEVEFAPDDYGGKDCHEYIHSEKIKDYESLVK